MRRMINSSGAFGGSLVFATAILMLYPQVDHATFDINVIGN